MIIMPIKEGENIERALKKFKRKYEKTGVLKELRRRQSSLRWGVILLALAIGFGLLEAFDWQDASPGLFAVLLGATGLGNLAAYYLARKAK